MNGKLKKTLRTIRDRVLWEKFFFNRGKSLASDLIELLTLTTVIGLFITLLNNNFHTHLDAGKAMMFVPPLMAIYWIIGRLDFKKIHIIQKENEIGMAANPALYEKVCRIDREIQEIKKANEQAGNNSTNNKSVNNGGDRNLRHFTS